MGRAIGEAGRGHARAARGARRAKPDLVQVLRAQGYEPREPDQGVVRLGNCPFHALVADHRDLVCGMNLALAEGIVEGLGDRSHVARLDPQPGTCCVVFEDSSSAGA